MPRSGSTTARARTSHRRISPGRSAARRLGPELELLLDDKHLPRPYVIDPIVIRSATAGVGFTSTSSGGVQTANISLTKPSGALDGDLLIAHVAVQMSATALTDRPAGRLDLDPHDSKWDGRYGRHVLAPGSWRARRAHTSSAGRTRLERASPVVRLVA